MSEFEKRTTIDTRGRWPRPRMAWLPWVVACAGCDPVINVQGAFFPAWIVCILGSLALTGLAHRLFVALDLQQHLGPLALIYPSLVVLLTMALWLLLYRS